MRMMRGWVRCTETLKFKLRFLYGSLTSPMPPLSEDALEALAEEVRLLARRTQHPRMPSRHLMRSLQAHLLLTGEGVEHHNVLMEVDHALDCRARDDAPMAPDACLRAVRVAVGEARHPTHAR